MSDPVAMDVKVLGGFLLLQNAMQAAPDEQRLGQVVAHGLAELPNVRSCVVCIEGNICRSAGDRTEWEQGVCKHPLARPSSPPLSCTEDGTLCEGEFSHAFPVATPAATYGNIVVEIPEPAIYQAYEPFLMNTASHVALHMENTRNAQALHEMNETLDAQVKTRTRELADREERLRVLFDQATDASFVADLEGRIVQVNPQACRSTGYTEEELLELTVADIDAGVDSLDATFEAVIAGGPDDSVTIQSAHRRKDGSTFPVEVTVCTISLPQGRRILGVARDISQRLRRQTEYSQVLMTAIDGFWVVNEDGEILEANPAAADLLGYAQEELVGMSLAEIDARQTVEDVKETMRHVGRMGAARFETQHRRKDGTIIDVDVSTSYLPHGGGRYVAFVRDITERQRLQAELAQAQKMESVGRLAGGVAHDFNNMLGVILGYTEMALQKLNEAHAAYQDLKQIDQAAERSAELTGQLLAFARKQTVSPKVLDLGETVSSMLRMLGRLIGEGIELKWQPGPDLWRVRIDPSQIDRVLANLCVNARDAIADVGTVTIAAENVHLRPADCADRPGFVPGEYVRLSVADTGVGIDPESLPHLFEPFYTTKAQGQGTGLGLATVYGIVRQNDGFVQVSSEPGAGTRISLHFPRHRGPTDTREGEPAEPEDGSISATVLLVEDEPALLQLGETMLESLGFEALAAATPQEALAKAKEHGGDIDLLVTDVIMPQMNGRDLAREMKALHPEIATVFMSGYPADVIAQHEVLNDGVHFLPKPFSYQAFADKIRQALTLG